MRTFIEALFILMLPSVVAANASPTPKPKLYKVRLTKEQLKQLIKIDQMYRDSDVHGGSPADDSKHPVQSGHSKQDTLGASGNLK